MVDSDGNTLLEYKVFSMCIYEVFSACDRQLPYHYLCNVYEVLADPLGNGLVVFSEYPLEKPQPLRKVKSILIKGVLIIVFS